MSVLRIEAVIDCDGCGARFRVSLDGAASRSGRVGKWAMFEVAEDALRGGVDFLGYIPERKPFDGPKFTGMDGDQHLCPVCATDGIPEE